MNTAVEMYIRSEKRSGADGHKTGIDDGGVEVQVDPLSQLHVGAVVDVDGGFDFSLICELGLVLVG